MSLNWPVADLDPIRRLRVMAASIPGTVLTEIEVPAPFETAWEITADLETSMPRLVRDFRRVRVTRSGDASLRMDVRGYLGQRARFDVDLRPGWCWMQSRLWVGGMAAQSVENGTVIGFLGGLRVPGAGLLVRTFQAPVQRMSREALQRLAEDIIRADDDGTRRR